MAKKIEWQSMDPEFPETAFIAMMYLKKGEVQMVLPLDLIYDTANQAKMAVERNEEKLKTNTGAVMEGVTIFEMRLRKKIMLKKEYWGDSPIKRDNLGTAKKINEFMKNPGLYQYLVLPSFYNDRLKEWRNSVSIPFFISGDDTRITNYFLVSGEGVDRRAKSAAMYTVVKRHEINWETKEIEEVDNTPAVDENVLAN